MTGGWERKKALRTARSWRRRPLLPPDGRVLVLDAPARTARVRLRGRPAAEQRQGTTPWPKSLALAARAGPVLVVFSSVGARAAATGDPRIIRHRRPIGRSG